jgi:hypothetical protein
LEPAGFRCGLLEPAGLKCGLLEPAREGLPARFELRRNARRIEELIWTCLDRMHCF